MKSILKKQVELTLMDYPNTRNSDIGLMIQIWKEFYAVGDSVSLADLYRLPREDNIKRIRASFNAEGKYWPTDLKVAIARGMQEIEWRRAMGYPAPQETTTPTKAQSYTERVLSDNLRPEVKAEIIREQSQKHLL